MSAVTSEDVQAFFERHHWRRFGLIKRVGPIKRESNEKSSGLFRKLSLRFARFSRGG
jgi:hypothetical protein